MKDTPKDLEGVREGIKEVRERVAYLEGKQEGAKGERERVRELVDKRIGAYLPGSPEGEALYSILAALLNEQNQ